MALERNSLTAGNMIRGIVRTLSDVFAPIIPAIVASGLLMGLVEGIDHLMAGTLQMNPWWILIHTFADASFVFLQILIGFSAARTFGGNEFLGGVIGMVANHTSLMNAWDIPTAIHRFGQAAFQVVGSRRAANWLSTVSGTQVSAQDASSQAIMAAGGVPQVDLIPKTLQVTLQGYQGHVLAVVAAVFLMCQLERWLHAHVPDMLDLFVTPLATVLLTSLAMMIVIGPAFTTVEELALSFFRFLLSIPFGVGTALAGALYPLTLTLGVHHLFDVYEASLCALTPPYNHFNAIVSAAIVAQSGACLAVALKSHLARRRAVALPASIAALLGVPAPAIYGINLPTVRPFAAAMLGGAVGGALVSVLDAYATSRGIVGVFGCLIAADANAYNLVLGASFAASFATALLLYQEAEVPAEAEVEAEPATEAADEGKVAEAEGKVAEDDAEVQVETVEPAAAVEAPADETVEDEVATVVERAKRPRRRPNRTRSGAISRRPRAIRRSTRDRAIRLAWHHKR